MSLTLYKSQRPPSELVESADLDVTPVMNMFIILIPFLVSMAVFTNLSILSSLSRQMQGHR
jgi:biopolymer transport protein ExbD